MENKSNSREISTCCMSCSDKQVNDAIEKIKAIEGVTDVQKTICQSHSSVEHYKIIVTYDGEIPDYNLKLHLDKIVMAQKMSGYNPESK